MVKYTQHTLTFLSASVMMFISGCANVTTTSTTETSPDLEVGQKQEQWYICAIDECTGVTPKTINRIVIDVSTPSTIKKYVFNTEVLFGFDKSSLSPEGIKTLSNFAKSLDNASINSMTIIGHTDRIGSQSYNLQLSELRAESVKEFISRFVPATKISTFGKGKKEPVTGNGCRGLSGSKLIRCLQPDRRVEIDVN